MIDQNVVAISGYMVDSVDNKEKYGTFRLGVTGLKDTDYIPCVVFGKNLETLTQYGKAGKHLLLRGRLTTSGTQVRIAVDDFTFLALYKSKDEKKEDKPDGNNQYPEAKERPF